MGKRLYERLSLVQFGDFGGSMYYLKVVRSFLAFEGSNGLVQHGLGDVARMMLLDTKKS